MVVAQTSEAQGPCQKCHPPQSASGVQRDTASGELYLGLGVLGTGLCSSTNGLCHRRTSLSRPPLEGQRQLEGRSDRTEESPAEGPPAPERPASPQRPCLQPGRQQRGAEQAQGSRASLVYSRSRRPATGSSGFVSCRPWSRTWGRSYPPYRRRPWQYQGPSRSDSSCQWPSAGREAPSSGAPRPTPSRTSGEPRVCGSSEAIDSLPFRAPT